MSPQPGDTGDSRPCPSVPTPGTIKAQWLPATPVVRFLLRAREGWQHPAGWQGPSPTSPGKLGGVSDICGVFFPSLSPFIQEVTACASWYVQQRHHITEVVNWAGPQPFNWLEKSVMIVKPVSAPSPEPAASRENTFQLISLYRAWGDTWPGTDCRTWWPAGNTRRLHEIQGTGAEPCSPEQRWSVPRQEAGQQPGRVDGSTAHLRAAQIHQKYIGLWRRWCHHQHSDAVPKHSLCTDTEREEE